MRARVSRDFVISRLSTSRLSSRFGLEAILQEHFIGMIRMNLVMKICGKVCFGAALSLVALAPVAHADEFKLSHNQRISCSRGLSAGKLNTATCKSYAYIFNAKTSEYFRCSVSLALTRDNKEVINVQTDGGCVKKPRIFETDSIIRSTPPRPRRRTPIRSSAPAATRSGPATPRRRRSAAASPSLPGSAPTFQNAWT